VRAVFGKGRGASCQACDLPITREDVEVTVEFSDGATLRAHASCFESWRRETQRST
jgi:hypothetical protein